MFTAKIEARGLPKIVEKLNKINKNLVPALDSTILEGGKMVSATAKQLAPYDKGLLSKGIYTRKAGHLRAVVRVNIPYAIYQELGFMMTVDMLVAMAKKGILKPSGKRLTYPHWVQNPFMRPALNANVPIIRDMMKDTIKRILQGG